MIFLIRFSFQLIQIVPIRNRKPLTSNQMPNINLNKVRSIDKLTFNEQKGYFFMYLNSASDLNTEKLFTENIY